MKQTPEQKQFSSNSKVKERINELLEGICYTEIDHDDGFWETSTGAEFGTRLLEKINNELDKFE